MLWIEDIIGSVTISIKYLSLTDLILVPTFLGISI